MGGTNMDKFLERAEKYYFHYPFPVVIVGTLYEDRSNFMAAAWHTQLSFDPPLYAVSISPKRYSKELVDKAGAFSLNFLKFDDYKLAGFVGRTSGRDYRKEEIFDIQYDIGTKLNVPVLKIAVGCYECKVVDEKPFGDHILYVGEIVGIHYDSDYYKDGISPDMLLYIGNDMYTHAEGTLVKFGREEVQDVLKGMNGEKKI